MEKNKNSIRLQVFLAKAGIASRRKCETYITQGKVSVDGTIITHQGFKVKGNEKIRFNGKIVHREKHRIYLALNKPSGFICSETDPDGRSLAKDLFGNTIGERIFNVGRLDYMSSGLIFFTNDGDFTRSVTHPSSQIKKEYLVTVKGRFPDDFMQKLVDGIMVEKIHYRAIEAELLKPHTARIVLIEGKNREIRRIFHSVSLGLKRVHRVRIGSVQLKGIKTGHFRHLKEKEIRSLYPDWEKKKD